MATASGDWIKNEPNLKELGWARIRWLRLVVRTSALL